VRERFSHRLDGNTAIGAAEDDCAPRVECRYFRRRHVHRNLRRLDAYIDQQRGTPAASISDLTYCSSWPLVSAVPTT
jgi:hypothetical protein